MSAASSERGFAWNELRGWFQWIPRVVSVERTRSVVTPSGYRHQVVEDEGRRVIEDTRLSLVASGGRRDVA
eukprot:1013483-Rhodomonas_salina.2